MKNNKMKFKVFLIILFSQQVFYSCRDTNIEEHNMFEYNIKMAFCKIKKNEKKLLI